MRRPHVYERSATRAARGARPEPSEDYGPAARAAVLALPDVLRQAEAAGAVVLARYLGQALSEAEEIVRRRCDVSLWHRSEHARRDSAEAHDQTSANGNAAEIICYSEEALD